MLSRLTLPVHGTRLRLAAKRRLELAAQRTTEPCVLRQTCAAEGAGTNIEGPRSAERLSETPLLNRPALEAVRGAIGVTGESAYPASGTLARVFPRDALPPVRDGSLGDAASVGYVPERIPPFVYTGGDIVDA